MLRFLTPRTPSTIAGTGAAAGFPAAIAVHGAAADRWALLGSLIAVCGVAAGCIVSCGATGEVGRSCLSDSSSLAAGRRVTRDVTIATLPSSVTPVKGRRLLDSGRSRL